MRIFLARPDVLCPDVTKTFVPVVDDFASGDDRPRNKSNKGITVGAQLPNEFDRRIV